MGLTSRPGLLNLGSQHHCEVATWLVQLGEEEMSRHPLMLPPGLASVRSRPGLVSRLGHCSGHCLDTVHEHCSQGKKNKKFKIFLGVI